MLAWNELKILVAEAQRIFLTTHVRPDGDALGSELALADLLNRLGKDVQIVNSSPTPARYRYLDPKGERFFIATTSDTPGIETPDLILIVDTGTWSQLAGLADYVRRPPAKKVVIDHHVSQDELGALRIVDTSASACGMLIHDAFSEFGMEPTRQTAEALFLAISMDTGWMRHSNTTPKVLRVLSELVAAGAQPNEIYRELFEQNTLQRMRLTGVMLERLSLSAGGKLASSYITQDDIRKASAHPMDTEDFINYPMSLAGVETAVLLIEQAGGGTKASFRSRGNLDCSKLAERFGGGGHRPAAGATLAMPLDEARVAILKATEQAMIAS